MTLLIQENSRPQDLIVHTDGSVTKDQSGWGFTVKQGATTIHEDSATYIIYSLLTDSMSLLQNKESGMGSQDWNVLMVDIHLQKLLQVYCPGHAGMKGNDRADRLAGKATITSGLLL